MASKGRLQEFLGTISKDLDRTMEFWFKHSHDEKYNGFITCLGKDGQVFDDMKFGWLQARQVWMYARLYNEVDRFRKPEILEQAEKGGKFLRDHILNPDTKKCYFSVTSDGSPVSIQRTLYGESFYLIAMSELARATGKAVYREEAMEMMKKIEHWVRVDDSEIGRPRLAGAQPVNQLGIPMIVLSLITQMVTMDPSLSEQYEEFTDYMIGLLFAHIQRDGKWICENVSMKGEAIPGSQGRVSNPGHAIEAGWFCLEVAQRRKDSGLIKKAIENFIRTPFEYGWDKEHGGIFYFLDADGLSPTQLEWNMKLWWPHNEAMVGFLMAYQQTGNEIYLDKFAQVFDYSYEKFCDPENGEWYGYLNRDGSVCMDFKAGPWKGCFHVPRCLMVCEKILKQLLSK